MSINKDIRLEKSYWTGVGSWSHLKEYVLFVYAVFRSAEIQISVGVYIFCVQSPFIPFLYCVGNDINVLNNLQYSPLFFRIQIRIQNSNKSSIKIVDGSSGKTKNIIGDGPGSFTIVVNTQQNVISGISPSSKTNPKGAANVSISCKTINFFISVSADYIPFFLSGVNFCPSHSTSFLSQGISILPSLNKHDGRFIKVP